MLREFTKDVGDGPVARFSKGEVRDYPDATWKQIGLNTRQKVDDFSRLVVSRSAVDTAASRAKALAKVGAGEVAADTTMKRRRIANG